MLHRERRRIWRVGLRIGVWGVGVGGFVE